MEISQTGTIRIRKTSKTCGKSYNVYLEYVMMWAVRRIYQMPSKDVSVYYIFLGSHRKCLD